MSGTDTAAMVPGAFDCIIDGYGYIFDRRIDWSTPGQTPRASYSFTPTFLERTNVGPAYGDDQQAFFLTAAQKDWEGGEGQRFANRDGDPDSVKRYYSSQAVHIGVPGSIQMRPGTLALTAGTIKASCPRGHGTIDGHAYSDSTHLFTVSNTATITDQGAHGAGTPNRFSMCTDGVNVYIAGTTKIRKWTGAAFSDFSAEASAGSLAFLNNALYSCDGSVLKTYSGAGVATTLFTWKDATNTAVATQKVKIVPFGGNLLIFFAYLSSRPELWIYDGTGTRRIAEFSGSMVGYDAYVVDGIVYLSGLLYDIPDDANVPTGLIEVVMYFVNGTVGELWRSRVAGDTAADFDSSSYPSLGSVNGKLVFTDPNAGLLMAYDLGSSAIFSLCALDSPVAAGLKAFPGQLSSCSTSVIVTWNTASVAGTFYPDTIYASTGTLISSIFQFDNSLTKMFRGIKVDWTGGGSVDIAYAVDAVSGHSSLQTSAVSGTEYTLPANTTGRGISYKLTLNKSGSNVPIVKRVYLRAAPIEQAYRYRQWVLDLTGREGKSPVRLNDDSEMMREGLTQATNLLAAIQSTTPLTIIDRFGTFTGTIEAGQSELIEVRPEQYIARVTVREV